MRVVVADDDKLVAMSLKTIINHSGDIEVVAVGSSAAEAIALHREYRPDIMLMDIRMGEQTGLDAAGEILDEFPEAKIIFLTTFSDDEYIYTALRLGAKGYLLKQDYESIIPSLRAVGQGQAVFGEEVVTKLSGLGTKKVHTAAEYGLSDKEGEIVLQVAEGLSNKEIAAKLFLSEGTVRNYISTVLEKLDLRDRTQLAIFYYNNLK